MKKIITHSTTETNTLAQKWLRSLDTSRDEATVVGLYGNLGAGKTTFTQAVAKELGVKDIVNSPTFVIEKLYETIHPHFIRLVHIDAYRLENALELQNLNFEELVSNSHNLIIIEWPENVKEILPENHIRIYCEFIDETSRKFEVQ
jgi:tRNA threonylcarbamoyladenosine biosynthesis protein TsaE